MLAAARARNDVILTCVGDGAGAGPRSVQITRRGIEGEILERGQDSGVAAGQLDVQRLGHSGSRVGPPAFAFGMCPGEPGVCVLNFWGGGLRGADLPTSQPAKISTRPVSALPNKGDPGTDMRRALNLYLP